MDLALANSCEKIKVLIVDDIITFRERFYDLLCNDKNIEIVGMAKSGKEAIDYCLKKLPDVILMDVVMETKIAGIAAAHKIISLHSDVKIIMLTVLEDDDTVFNAFQIGAVDYLLKNASQQDVIESVHAAFNNCSTIKPLIAKKIRREFKKLRNNQESFMYLINLINSLTKTEIKILLLYCENNTRQEIADTLCIELSTVKTHINRMLKKLNMKNTKEIVKTINKMQLIQTLKQVISNDNNF